MNRISISAVSYLNTIPFLYGLEHYKKEILDFDLSLDIPSVCAEKLLSQQVDIGLVPVAVLEKLASQHIITNFCISAMQKVDSVLLLSDVPLNEIDTIILDYQSKSSVKLVQILAHYHWGIYPKWVNAEQGFEQDISGRSAAVVIGDRTFNLKEKFEFAYDLAKGWYELTGLPFVFACWVANRELPVSYVEKFNNALAFGVASIDEAIDQYERFDYLKRDVRKHYLSNVIKYNLTNQGRAAIRTFQDYIKKLESFT